MTEKELWKIIDSIDIDSRDNGKFTEEEMYEIGCNFIEMNNSQKREFGGWDKLVEVLKPLDKNGDPMKKGDTFRQWIKNKRYSNSDIKHNEQLISGKTINNITFEEFREKTESLKQDLYKQQVKTRDTENSYRRTLREDARVENMISLIEESIKTLPNLPEIVFQNDVKNECFLDGTEAVVLLSDMHIGANINCFYNKYNVEEARKRVEIYTQEIIRQCKKNNVKRLNILNLGDMIMGDIHVSARIEAREDLITQIITASEIIAQMLNELQDAAPEIIYRSCTDNHSRAMPDIKQNIEKENFQRIIEWYLTARLSSTKIQIINDNLDDDVGVFELMNGKTVLFVHGHRDKNFERTVFGISNTINKKIDFLCLGHYHSCASENIQGTKVITNGSIMGSDQFASSQRLFGPAEQTIIIFDNKSVENITVRLN